MATVNIPASFLVNIRIYMFRLNVERELSDEFVTRLAVGAKRAGYRLNSRKAALYTVATMKVHDLRPELSAIDCRDAGELIANSYGALIELKSDESVQINLIDILQKEAANLSTKKISILSKMGVALDVFRDAVAKRNKAAMVKGAPVGKRIALAILKKVH